MTGKEDFAARVARIQAGGVGSKGTIYVGQNEAYYQERVEKIPPSKTKELAGNALYPAGLAGAFLLGMFAVGFGRYVRFQIMAGHHFEANLDMAINMAMGLCVSFVLSQMFRLTNKEHLGLQSMGVFVMVCTFHNLVHWMPRAFEVAFSPAWVEQVLTTTQPNSILFRGATFLLTPEAEEAPPATAPDTVVMDSATAASDADPQTGSTLKSAVAPLPRVTRLPGGADAN